MREVAAAGHVVGMRLRSACKRLVRAEPRKPLRLAGLVHEVEGEPAELSRWLRGLGARHGRQREREHRVNQPSGSWAALAIHDRIDGVPAFQRPVHQNPMRLAGVAFAEGCR